MTVDLNDPSTWPRLSAAVRVLALDDVIAVLYHRKPHEDALRSWEKKLIQTKPFRLVAVALANKMARIAFAIMRGKTTYSAAPV